MAILNLTQHLSTKDQLDAGLVDLTQSERAILTGLLTFDVMPTAEDIRQRANTIAALAAYNARPEDREDGEKFALQAMTGRAAPWLMAPLAAALIGGAPWLMAPLIAALVGQGITPLFAFTKREVEEVAQQDGSVRKVAVFRHAGFIPAVYG